MARLPSEPPDEPEDEDAEEALPLDEEAAPGEAEPEHLTRGAEVIRRFWKTLPNDPGVYRMIGAGGEVLYVGKARSLKKRVASYTRGLGHSNRIARMIAATEAMEFVTTETEAEALLLETNYIKQLKPRFNVLMRDDKSFPYILITGDHPAPQIVKHRGARNRKGDYFGPFASAQAVGRTINALQRAFLLRTCTDSYYENRTRPCLLFQIKRCAAPCTGEVSIGEYRGLVDEARDFLSGRSQAVRQRIAAEMQAASDDLEFERAARYRDRLAALSATTSTQDINPADVEEADVFAIHEEAGQFIVEVFFFRTGQNWGNRAFYPRADRSMGRAEVLGAFMAQFYNERPAPRLILMNEEIEDGAVLAEALSGRAGHKIEISVPRRGPKRDLVDHAAKNAREALSRKLADTASQQKLLATIGVAFGLEKPPRRVDVFDNSHIMGTNAVGGMIVAGEAGFMKTHYRTFNIKSEELTPGDDYGMMREVLHRRFARLQKDAPRDSDPESFPQWPDLVLIDGGKGQLDAARMVLAELGITDVPLVGIAKGPDRDAGRETFFIEGRTPFKLPPREPALYFVQRLRDEAHRFAIGTHRAKRKREMTKSPLDEIAGIGPRRKRALLLHFGTAKAVSRASLADLSATPGVNEATARAVYDFFHEKEG
ncbi:MAG: excinuclease ABC subunit UvrC [Proteobacteria bacterium]|nr:excinuclease ABC subunit UvrC [Pseudomonadota bacterium]